MTYNVVRERTRTRFNEVSTYLNFIASIEPKDINEQASLEVKITRGLFHVHLYAALEKTVNDLVEYTLTKVSSKKVKHNHYVVPFNTISLIHKLKSFKDSGYSSFIPKATEIFESMICTQITPIDETAFSNSLQNVWVSTIDEVRRALGMNTLSIGAREKATINELVEKRNAVAHGRESAATIGERHRSNVLRTKMDIVVSFAYQQIDDFEVYYDNKTYIKPLTRKYYN